MLYNSGGGGGTVAFDGNTARTADLSVGPHTALDASNNKITGPNGWTIKVGAPGTTGVIDHVSVNNNTVAGQMTVIDYDSNQVYWFNPDDNHPLGSTTDTSSLSVNNDTVGKAVYIQAGDYYRTVSVTGLTALDLSAQIGSFSQNVQFNTNITGNNSNYEDIQIGDFVLWNPPAGLIDPSVLPPAFLSVTGTAGYLNITAGENANVSVSGFTATKNDGNGSAVSVLAKDGATIALNKITADHGGVYVTAGDSAVMIAVTNTTASNLAIVNGNGSTFFDLEHDNLGTNGADQYTPPTQDAPQYALDLQSGYLGNGNDTGSTTTVLNALNVVDGLGVFLNSSYLNGANVTASTVMTNTVVCDFGTIDGGSLGTSAGSSDGSGTGGVDDTSNAYIDLNPGSSSGSFAVVNFAGYADIPSQPQ
jgi:hypothetical protein